jgi:hypothetical protein
VQEDLAGKFLIESAQEAQEFLVPVALVTLPNDFSL